MLIPMGMITQTKKLGSGDKFEHNSLGDITTLDFGVGMTISINNDYIRENIGEMVKFAIAIEQIEQDMIDGSREVKE